MILKTTLCKITWTVRAMTIKTRHRNFNIAAQIGTLTFRAQVRYFIEKKKREREITVLKNSNTRTIQG